MQDLLGWYFSLNLMAGIAAAILARRRGHEGLDSFFITLFLTPLVGIPHALNKEELPDSPQSRGQWFTSELSAAAALSAKKKRGQQGIVDEIRLCPHCAAPITTKTKICPACNKAVAMDALVALMAGKPVPGTADAPGDVPSSTSVAQPAAGGLTVPFASSIPASVAMPAASTASSLPQPEPTPSPAPEDPDLPPGQKKSEIKRSWDEPGRYALNAQDVPRFHLVIGEESKGPFTVGDLQRMWNMIEIDRTVLYWEEGMEEWQPLGELFDKGILSNQGSIPASSMAPVTPSAAGTPEAGTQSAGSASSAVTAEDTGYHIILAADSAGNQLGPLTEEEVLEAVRTGNLERDDLVRYPNSSEWLPIHLSGFPAKVALQKKPWSFNWMLAIGLIGFAGVLMTGKILMNQMETTARIRQLNESIAGTLSDTPATTQPAVTTPTVPKTPSVTPAGNAGGISSTAMKDLAGFGLTEIRKTTDDASAQRTGFVYAYASIDRQGTVIQEYPSNLYLAEIRGRSMLIFGKTFNIKESYQAKDKIVGTVLSAESDSGDAERLYLYSVPEKSINPTTRWPQYNRTYVLSEKRPAV
ncbi:MAG: GYF domain-containing protein, partial [Candidatus Methylacidiphilales bacterium]|nr:GYF domain-containing protein [Candidatus Methylacidiphilales bacterium]